MNCRVCGTLVGASRRFVAREMMLGLREEFEIAECSACRSLNLMNAPHDLSPYYPSNGYYSLDESPLDDLGRLSRRAAVRALWGAVCLGQVDRSRRILSRLPDRRLIGVIDMLNALRESRVPIKGAQVLDVGSGIGVSTFIIGQLGAVPLGIDPFGIEWTRGTARQIRCEIGDVDGAWDIILFQHSLEHLFDPLAALVKARALLGTDGRVIVRIPTSDSFACRQYASNWIDLDAPRHMFIPSREGLATLAKRAGLDLETTYDDARDIQFWGSEQYARDISLYDDRSAIMPKQSLFSPRKMKQWARQTEELNSQGYGDLVTAVFKIARDDAN